MFIILVSLYFVKDKSNEHSLILYWTALVYGSLVFLLVVKYLIEMFRSLIKCPVLF